MRLGTAIMQMSARTPAASAVPTALVEELALIGPEDKIRHDLEEWRESIATTLLVGGDVSMVRKAAELVLT